MIVVGLIVGTVALVVVFADRQLGYSRLLSNGPLTSAHAPFELKKKCEACHEQGGEVSDAKCNACHERSTPKTALLTYGLPAHYVYRSDDPTREIPKPDRDVLPHRCIDCHTEHLGRDASITDIPDARCAECHENDAFASGHHEFEFAVKKTPDAGSLRFTHGQHLCLVMKRGFANPESACLYCHNPNADGRGFAPIRFERHCGDSGCHLPSTERVAKIRANGPGRPGVESLPDIAKRREPGTAWVAALDKDEVRLTGDQIEKESVYHRDPWVLWNLRNLRRQAVPGATLADLLIATPDASIEGTRALYLEAVATLEAYASELRERPQVEVRGDVELLQTLLRQLRADATDPRARLDARAFALPATVPQEYKAVGRELMSTCTRQCHAVEDLTVARVQKSQRVLKRAEFDHRAHVIDRRCNECHDQIDMTQSGSTDCVANRESDRAEIQHVPKIATCQECHAPNKASDRCTECHAFHPNVVRSAQLTLTPPQE
jgi:hypothetical protein